MKIVGALIALALGWGLCAPAHAQNELFPLQAIPGGGGGGNCAGGNSPYVPAGYQCVSSDEFSGSSIDTSKWQIGGLGNGQGGADMVSNPSGGYVELFRNPCPSNLDCSNSNGQTGAALVSLFPMPDAPAYIEFRTRVAYGVTGIMQFWLNNCSYQAPCSGEETDVDMGDYNGCSTGTFHALCSGRFQWDNGNNAGFLDGSYAGDTNVVDGNWHIIGLQRLPDPAPNGTLLYSVDGQVVKTLTDMADDRWIYPSHKLQSGSWGGRVYPHDVFELDVFCEATCSDSQEIDWDYVRVYTPSGLPNGY